MNQNIIRISNSIKEKFIKSIHDSNEISVFLCGGNSKEELKFRKEFGNRISKIISKYSYSVHYPEDMFIELIFGYYKNDLLTLENLLASWVNVIIILLNSAGTFTELGAFSNHEILRNKLVVIIDPKYEKARSFINRGPVKYLKNNTNSKIIYSKLDYTNINKLLKPVSDAIRHVSKKTYPIEDLTNPLIAYDFFLALIYVFDPISENHIIKIAQSLESNKLDKVTYSTTTVISGLINERKVFVENNLLKITKQGLDFLVYQNKSQTQSDRILRFLSKLRFEALNITLRTKYKHIWRDVTIT